MIAENSANSEHERSKASTRFEDPSVAACVRRTRDEGFEKPVDNYGSSSSSRGTPKEKQGWRWAARTEPTKALSPFTSSAAMTSVICQDIPPMDRVTYRNQEVPKHFVAATSSR